MVVLDIFLQLCGAADAQVTSISHAEFILDHRNALAWVILLSLALAALAWWSYRGTAEVLSRMRRTVLTSLRSALFALFLFLLLLQPALTFTVENIATN